MLDQETLQELQALLNKNTFTNIIDIIKSNIQIDYVDYPVIDHNTQASYIDLPEVRFKTTIPIIYVFLDMKKEELNIDNPQFIPNFILVSYIKNMYFYFDSEFNNYLVNYIKTILYKDFNLEFHLEKSSLSSQQLNATFNSYYIDTNSIDIKVVENTITANGVLKVKYT